MEEIWRDIDGYKGLYQVSNLGNVKSLMHYRKGINGNLTIVKEKILKQNINRKNGYLVVSLCKNGISKTSRVNRLVAETFISNPYNLPQVNHIDGNKLNNNKNNLEWCSAKRNMNEAVRIGLFKNVVKKVAQYDMNNNLIEIYSSITEASRKTGITNTSISYCANGKRKNGCGYIWKFIGDE